MLMCSLYAALVFRISLTMQGACNESPNMPGRNLHLHVRHLHLILIIGRRCSFQKGTCIFADNSFNIYVVVVVVGTRTVSKRDKIYIAPLYNRFSGLDYCCGGSNCLWFACLVSAISFTRNEQFITALMAIDHRPFQAIYCRSAYRTDSHCYRKNNVFHISSHRWVRIGETDRTLLLNRTVYCLLIAW